LIDALVFFTLVNMLIASASARRHIERVRSNRDLPGDHWYRARGLRSPRDVSFTEVFVNIFVLLWFTTLLVAPLWLLPALRHS
jgi:hypothetical protein